jgi:hypothetical protein
LPSVPIGSETAWNTIGILRVSRRSATLIGVVRDRWPAESFTFTLGPLKASADALLNYRAFELAQPLHKSNGPLTPGQSRGRAQKSNGR